MKITQISVYNTHSASAFSTTQGGVCIYYKHSLPFKLLDICYLEEYIYFEVSFGGKL